MFRISLPWCIDWSGPMLIMYTLSPIFHGMTISPSKILFSTKTYWYFSDFSIKTYIVGTCRASMRCKSFEYPQYFLGEIRKLFIWIQDSSLIQRYDASFIINAQLLLNPCLAEPGYTLPLQIVYIQISWLLKKPTDLDRHCLPLNIWISSNNWDQVIWLAEN